MRQVALTLLLALAACGAPAVPSTPRAAAAPACTAPYGHNTTATTTYHNVFTTAYDWWDNTPPGSGEIAYPRTGRATAGGTGTYADPTTLAVGWCAVGGKEIPDFKPGARVYIPNVRRYFSVDDQCGDPPNPQGKPCHTPEEGALQVDMWIDGRASEAGAAACMDAVTKTVDIVLNPAAGLPVVSGPVYGSRCTAQYGNTIPSA
jgi:hypothetical protein